MKLTILFEDNHIIAVEKEAGILSQGDSSGEPSLLDEVRDYIKERYNKPGKVFIGLVHRLDRPVSGIMVFARTSKAAERLHREFAGRGVIKMYLALVEKKGALPSDEWVECEDELVGKRGYSERAGSGSRNVRTAKMRYRLAVSNGRYALLLVHLLTGRKHQIRAQLSMRGMPIVGDETYGSGERLPDGSICLHAAYMGFRHPVKDERVELFSEAPRRIAERIEADDTIREKIISSLDNFS
ncbi:MAG TPA: RluA family pseudouridine synthase [Spirochaetota bacterium]|nr:RluA family pseudouridine synthase [Spirochaetota bacterium]HPC40829.1 RluA family pseudouridine synthase [Spirochaetota bacterium]HPL18718.1 RluA family pseudouridine synthase [Spirochaetota bacterium]HQF07781.1 RluA family pseudouridine synthase [Spirochaetota bacterium]HQH96834.1 RluA family pseudouridine synthase [Spirochaetota bacterium]